MTAVAIAPATRGTSNGNVRGNTEDRRRRREWLIETYRADVDAALVYWPDSDTWSEEHWGEDLLTSGLVEAHRLKGPLPACRCYRCGVLLTVETVTVDRIIPGCQGGTYRRNNIRPACETCNSSTGGALANQGKRR